MHKKIIGLLLLGFLGLSTVKAQIIVSGINVNNLDIQYIELIGYNRAGYQASIWIDFGRNYDPSRAGEFLKPLNDQERVRFTSVVDALNYFYKNDWEVVQAYAVGEMKHYVLQRRNRTSK